jgi:ribosomal protein L37E
MSDVIRCEGCHTPIAVGRIDAGALAIKCRRCGYKTLVLPQKECAARS